jgi:hypothetical protein
MTPVSFPIQKFSCQVVLINPLVNMTAVTAVCLGDIALSCTVQRNSYSPPAGRSCMTQHQAEQHIPDESQISLRESNKNNLPIF